MLSKLVLLAVIPAVVAECSNGCSGNGVCGNYRMQLSITTPSIQENEVPTVCTNIKQSYRDAHTETCADGAIHARGYLTTDIKKDSCTCFTHTEGNKLVYAYTGADCSLRTCPYGASWDAPPVSGTTVREGQTVTTVNHDYLVECSNRGKCDRKTGVCMCAEGYEGKGCRRSTCPNECSHHGVCKTAHEITKLLSENTAWDSFSEFEYTDIQYRYSWDSHKIRGCECDPGWRGPDCSIAEAPSNPDPMGGPGSESGRECSGRGFNDGEGNCVCYTGFFGAACDEQRANVM
jgi:hypothetical protein